MALKFISFAELLEIGGDGGISGDTGCKAPVHAGFTDPTVVQQASPLVRDSGSSGISINSGGDTRTQQPCGLQNEVPTYPTDPTDPTEFEKLKLETKLELDNWRELAAAYHAHHFNCKICIAAGRGPRNGQRCGAGKTLWRAYSV